MLAGIEGFTLTKRKMRNVHEKLDAVKEKIRAPHTRDTRG